jgi:hypothetical protein
MVTTRETSAGTLTLTRSATAEKFFCQRCRADKVSKLRAVFKTTDGLESVICNGCHGQLIALYGEP